MATKERVFETLTEPMNISQWSGDEAVMEKRAGGDFSLWGGSIHGQNLVITKSRIVQIWKEKNWKHFSKVQIQLIEKKGATILHLIQEDVPDGSYKSLNEGWDKYYLGAIKSFLES